MDLWHDFPGPNAGYILELYDRYRQNPESVDEATRAFFSHWSPPTDGLAPAAVQVDAAKIVGVVNLAHAIRAFGHLAARLDPLGAHPRGDPSLDLVTYGLSEEDLRKLSAALVGGPVAETAENAWEAIQALRAIYSSTTGHDYDHIRDPEERDWLRYAAESRRFFAPQDQIDASALLDRLTQVEAFEQFLNRVFPGKTRFSLEGLDVLVPMLDEIITRAAGRGVRNILIGMAHRGRLNVLAHILHKPYTQILAEFKDPMRARDLTLREELGWTGDVKYHAGAEVELDDSLPVGVKVTLPPNPSHVESSDSVVEGMARAAGSRVNGPGPSHFDPQVTLPILIHGDAAFPGQGIVAETLNLSRLPGYYTGGTIHIIENNQLGYTTNPQDGRSTLYASDLAKGFEIPIVHVNADDVTACIAAARLACEYRARFRGDFLVDLIGYRRHGHNEGDEPSFTQPVMYRRIEEHPSVRAIWANALRERGVVRDDYPKELLDRDMADLQQTLETLRPEEELAEPLPEVPPPGAARKVKTAVPADKLRALNEALLRVPEGFALNPKLERAMRRRRTALDNPDENTIDWATAEQLAFASILADGTAIRLTGEDVERGTFGQRHVVFHDVQTGARYAPLQVLPEASAAFAVYDSPLSENAALGFEYGYNVEAPERLVLWEAQYGDFVNGAQMIIDEFISSARAKWGQTPSLVILLPHAFEGQGPDHSSARPERFLSLAAETNMRIAYPTTAAQYFHLLRRQAALLKTDPLPLIALTAKSLLRHPLAASSLRDLAEGHWQPVIDDSGAREHRDQVHRLVLCSGKVHVDLETNEERAKNQAVAVARVEQLYPYPQEELESVLNAYPNLAEVAWLQEEPENMGAWGYMRPLLTGLIHGRWPLRYIGRLRNASPAEGSMARHARNQKLLVEEALSET